MIHFKSRKKQQDSITSALLPFRLRFPFPLVLSVYTPCYDFIFTRGPRRRETKLGLKDENKFDRYPSIHFTLLTLRKILRTSGKKQLFFDREGFGSGFTLVEVMLAMMIAGLVLSPIFSIFGAVLQRVNKSSRRYEQTLLCKNFLYEARQKQEQDAHEFSLEKKEVAFDATLTYSLEKGVSQASSLKSMPGLQREVVTIVWQENGQKKQDQLIAFVYKKPEQKK